MLFRALCLLAVVSLCFAQECGDASATYDQCSHRPLDGSVPLTVVSATGGSVTFTVSQPWKEDSISWAAVDYTDFESGDDVCPKTNEVASDAELGPFTAQCHNGVAQVTIYVHDGQFTQTDGADITSSIPDRCSPSVDAGRKCAVVVSVPCTPCGASDASCTASDVVLVEELSSVCMTQPVGFKPSSEFPPSDTPLVITSASGSDVTFNVYQYWKEGATESISWIAVDYLSGATGNQECSKTDEVSSGLLDSFTAECVDGFATVTLYVHDGKIATSPDITSSIPDRCEPSSDLGRKCQYTYQLCCSAFVGVGSLVGAVDAADAGSAQQAQAGLSAGGAAAIGLGVALPIIAIGVAAVVVFAMIGRKAAKADEEVPQDMRAKRPSNTPLVGLEAADELNDM